MAFLFRFSYKNIKKSVTPRRCWSEERGGAPEFIHLSQMLLTITPNNDESHWFRKCSKWMDFKHQAEEENDQVGQRGRGIQVLFRILYGSSLSSTVTSYGPQRNRTSSRPVGSTIPIIIIIIPTLQEEKTNIDKKMFYHSTLSYSHLFVASYCESSKPRNLYLWSYLDIPIRISRWIEYWDIPRVGDSMNSIGTQWNGRRLIDTFDTI